MAALQGALQPESLGADQDLGDFVATCEGQKGQSPHHRQALQQNPRLPAPQVAQAAHPVPLDWALARQTGRLELGWLAHLRLEGKIPRLAPVEGPFQWLALPGLKVNEYRRFGRGMCRRCALNRLQIQGHNQDRGHEVVGIRRTQTLSMEATSETTVVRCDRGPFQVDRFLEGLVGAIGSRTKASLPGQNLQVYRLKAEPV